MILNGPDIFPSPLRTERLMIVPMDRDALLGLYRGGPPSGSISDLKVTPGWPMEGLREALPVMLNDLMDDPSSFGWHAWAVALKGTDEVIGDVGFKGPPDKEGVVEIGFSTIPRHRGKGYATEAVKGLIRYVGGTGKVRVVYARCDVDNLASMKVLGRIGVLLSVDGSEAHWRLS